MKDSSSTLVIKKTLRLDKLLAESFPELSRSYFHFLFDQKAITLNHVPIKKREILPIDSEVKIHFIQTEELVATPENIALDVLFEDEHIIAVNKPVGMVVHPAPGHPNATFVNALLYHCQLDDQLKEDTLRPGIVHRLDKDTSGVLLAAKTRKAHQKLIETFASRSIEKTYLCIALDKIKDQTLTTKIKRHPKNRQKMTCCEIDGKESKTSFTLLDFQSPFSLISCQLHTGRTHQIRVHLSFLGHPIIGDSLYGNTAVNKSYNTPRQLLHAHSVKFSHPITNAPISIIAPLPLDMQNWMKKNHLQHAIV